MRWWMRARKPCTSRRSIRGCDMAAHKPPHPIPPAKAKLTEGVKYDSGKPRFDLIPPKALEELAKVYAFGAEKYASRNWEQGMDWGRVYAATQRHLNAWWGGEETDPETGLSHLAHAMFGLCALQEFHRTDIGLDDRSSL